MKHTIFLAVLLCSAITAAANNAKISGRIKDANDKSSIIGATVLLMQDTAQIAGTTTDNSGKFTIDAGNGDYILELSYIGYESRSANPSAIKRADAGFLRWRFSVTELANSAYRD